MWTDRSCRKSNPRPANTGGRPNSGVSRCVAWRRTTSVVFVAAGVFGFSTLFARSPCFADEASARPRTVPVFVPQSAAGNPKAQPASESKARPASEPKVDFSHDIRPILAAKCFACHGPDKESREAGLELNRRDQAIRELESGATAIVPGKSNQSELIARVLEKDEDMRMPPPDAGDRLKPQQIEQLRRWIDQGADYARHWSYIPPVRPALPKVKNKSWPRNPIDYFVLARLEAAELAPETEADRYRLVRRLSLDLIGLPPTIEEADAFVYDNRPDAYERLVDRLLASPHYGEHWARNWLDLARYADSKGYAQDELRNIWRYRDWLIDALNRDLPFDQFTIQQLAGDLLPNPTPDQLIATAFHRNTMTNTEGGTDDEEFRVAAVIDRVNTTMQVWMGVTMGCAQCHSHKFDPIAHEEYYQMFAIFNQTSDYDQPDERPTLFAPSADQQRRLDELNARIADIEHTAVSPSPELPDLMKELKRARDEIEAIKEQRTPILQELSPEKRRQTHVHIRGSFLNQGEVVEPQTPVAFGPLPGNCDHNRLALARWLVGPENPLTARVAVNRHWEQLFGTGLVETSEDFGSQGALPSHPELLDWLAVEFRESGWSMKQLSKTIVMSATYRQSSRVTPEKLEADPQNRLLSRGPRFRLSAEEIRDSALAASGLLSKKLGGPSVRPPQPQSGFRAAFGASLDWKTSTGEDRYRRGIYTLIRRVNPYPSLVALGATNRTTCTIRRVRTNTPVGAFVTLNDPVFVEAAQALARRKGAPVESSNSNQTKETRRQDVTDRVDFLFRCVLARHPTARESASLSSLYRSALEAYRADEEAATKMATDPLGPAPKGTDLGELASWAVVCNVILNLDEALTKD